MQIDPSRHSAAENYKLLSSLVVPRPIAWVTSVNDAGVVNLAPFSFFNAVGSDPLYVVISIGTSDARNEAGGMKDTAKNILASGEFVVNMVTEELFDAMNVSAADFPAGMSELEVVNLHAAPSVKVKPPRVAESQASMECKLHSSQLLGENTLVIGEVVMFHVADQLVSYGEDTRLQVHDFAPVGRLGVPSFYCRTTDRLDVKRISYAEWEKGGN